MGPNTRAVRWEDFYWKFNTCNVKTG